MNMIELLNEFREKHYRLADGDLIIRSEDRRLVERQRNFIQGITGLHEVVEKFGQYFQIKYHFAMRDWLPMVDKLKEYNFGTIKTGTVQMKGAYPTATAVENSKYVIPFEDIGRVFAVPNRRGFNFVTKGEHIGYLVEDLTGAEIDKFLKAIRKNKPDAYPFIINAMSRYKEEADTKQKEIITAGARFYSATVTGEPELRIRSSKSLEGVRSVLHKMYGVRFKGVEEIDNIFVELEDLVKEYNVKIAEQIKALQEGKVSL